MARLSRLLSAVSLGLAATAAVAAVAVSVGREYAPVHKSPRQLAESTSDARVIVKFKSQSTILSASTSSTGSGVRGPQKAGVLGTRLGMTLTDGRILGERTQVLQASGMTSSALAASVGADSEVEWVQVDHRRFIQASPVNDPLYPDNVVGTTPASGQWYLRAPGVDASGRDVVSSINVEPAWAITHGSSAVVVADVDTGITQHPDLDSKVLTGYDFISRTKTSNDGDGRDADPSDPGDYVTATENSTKGGPYFACNDPDADTPGQPVPANSSWHGTQTAGLLAAATNNAAGMAGTGYDTKFVPARALGKCGGWDDDIIAAAEWSGGIHVNGVTDNAHPARVINMSLGGPGTCATDAPAYVDALTQLRNKGVVVVAAAGNDNGQAVGIPANCKPAASDSDQTPIVIGVAALRHTGTKVGFSDIGPQVAVAAPGGNCVLVAQQGGPPVACLYPMLTTVNSGTTTPVTNGGTYTGSFGAVSLGTSFSTPLVTSTVALMLSANPALTNADVSRIIKGTVRPFPTVSDTSPQPATCVVPVVGSKAEQDECICTTSTCGAGMLDAGVAVARAWAEAGKVSTQPVADITASSSIVVVGTTLTLSSSASVLGSGGAALVSEDWSLPDHDGLVTLSASTGTSVTVTGVAAGTTHVMLKITDASGQTSQYTIPLKVNIPVDTGGGAGGSGGGGGGGGGAANPAWLAALALAGLLLGPRTRRPRA